MLRQSVVGQPGDFLGEAIPQVGVGHRATVVRVVSGKPLNGLAKGDL